MLCRSDSILVEAPVPILPDWLLQQRASGVRRPVFLGRFAESSYSLGFVYEHRAQESPDKTEKCSSQGSCSGSRVRQLIREQRAFGRIPEG